MNEINDFLRKHMGEELLRYAVGRQITCPGCGKVLDFRSATLIELRIDGKDVGMDVFCPDCAPDDDKIAAAITAGAQKGRDVRVERTTKKNGTEIFGATG